MAESRLLYFTAESHSLYRTAGQGLELEARFSADEAGLNEFREHLRARRGALFSVMVDLAGEDFHEDQIPSLRGGDREAVLARRLATRYRDTRLATALSLGYVTAGERRNERLLLASFTSTQQITPWLDALDASGARLAGVYSVPLLAPALAAKLGTRAGHAILVSANRAGLRQCFIDEGRLRFARLERTADMAPQALAAFVRSETQRLAQYLLTLRLLPREGGPVQVVALAPAGASAVFEQTLVSDARLVFRTVDTAEAARAVGLAQAPDTARAEVLYLQLAAKRPPREQFASRADRRRYFIWQLQRAVVAAGVAGLALCALVAGSRWIDAAGTRERAAEQSRQAQLAASQYQRITAAFPVTQTSTENLKLAVVEFRRLAERNAAPEQAFVHVSRVLREFPQVELDALNWRVDRRPERREAKPPAGTTSPARPEAQGGDLAEIVEISGRVNATQRDDFRGITAQVQRFAAALGRSGYEVLGTPKLPFDITSEGTLTGDIGGGGSDEAPRFTIVLTRRLP